jgi:hypothetical protein
MAKPPEPEAQDIRITAPLMKEIRLRIRSESPLVVSRFSSRTQEKIHAQHELGSVGRKGKQREPREFDAEFEGARHRLSDGSDGFAASALRNAAISACRLVGFKMTLAKLSIFTIHDGLDIADGTPLVRIIGPPPEPFEAMVRNANSIMDLRVRPMWREWGAILAMRYDAAQFSGDDIANLVMRVGAQVGFCEGRADSRNSAGIGFGHFRLMKSDETYDDLTGKRPMRRAA